MGIQGHDVASTVSLSSWGEFILVDCHTFSPVTKVKTLPGGPVPCEVQTHHLRTSSVDSVYGRLIRSFMHTVVFFVGSFAGFTQSTATLARWLDTEPLILLRKVSPERPYSMPEISSLRETCFRSVTVTTFDELPGKMFDGGRAHPHGAFLSFKTNFRLMLSHLCEYASAPFDLFGATDAQSPLPACSVRYVERFFAYSRKSGIDPVPQLAINFVRESVNTPFSSFSLEETWKRRYLPLVIKLRARSHDVPLATRLEEEIRRLARLSQILGDSIAAAHRASLSTAHRLAPHIA
ncbi:hypothetical protein F5Y03DRAFT_401560 [Xylaria venustula]|nr:hypothetical protein F5Y03DRAFT_401560 [Xylaria venustula]